MLVFIGVIILLASALLGLFVLVQNPKGGGLSGTFGGFNSSTMGVRQTTDFLEKGTWVLVTIIAVLCLSSTMFMGHSSSSVEQKSIMEQNSRAMPNTSPAGAFPATNNPATPAQQAPAGQQPSTPPGDSN